VNCASKSGVAVFACACLLVFKTAPARAQGINQKTESNARVPVVPSSLKQEHWAPEDIDHAVPPVQGGTACSLPEVLSRAGRRVQELVDNVDRFTATEVLSHQSVDRSGRMRRPVTLKFDYLVSIATGDNGFLQVEEFRNRSRSLDAFPSHIATTGLSSLVLIFHPLYVADFTTGCEGLGDWNGHPAWLVRFEQRSDRPNHISAFVVHGAQYAANLRGRAWILADSFQIARLDTDQKDLIPKIQLRRSHISIEYQPVAFPKNNLQLWLPSSAEVYMDFKGQRFYRKHSLTDFKLFSVDSQYEVIEPKDKNAASQTAQ
jgi:hypothetical protein